MSTTSTRGIRVTVQPRYMADQSEPEREHYLFAYQVTIHNEGTTAVQLKSRHWIITNGEGKVEEVRGAGVVGEQPTLAPGDSFTYTSGCPLATPVGTMHGSYQMVTEDGEPFDAVIEPFRLAVPRALN